MSLASDEKPYMKLQNAKLLSIDTLAASCSLAAVTTLSHLSRPPASRQPPKLGVTNWINGELRSANTSVNQRAFQRVALETKRAPLPKPHSPDWIHPSAFVFTDACYAPFVTYASNCALTNSTSSLFPQTRPPRSSVSFTGLSSTCVPSAESNATPPAHSTSSAMGVSS